MLSLFALMLQTATLETDNASAALTCAQAVTIADSAAGKSPMVLTSQFTHYAMQSAVAKRSDKSFFEQLNEIGAQVSARPKVAPEQAKALVPLCEGRFPKARSTVIPKLPRDAFRRDVLCFGTLSVLQGAAQEMEKTGQPNELPVIQAALKPLLDRMGDDELNKRGLNTDGAFLEVMADEQIAALASSNPLTVAAACGVKLK